MPMVSIIMPVYNVEKYISASIESVLAQTYTDYELILVDDGSPDGCPAICDAYATEHPNIRVIHKQNGGLSSARNIGIENAAGKYILFVDSDDTIEPNLLENVVPAAEKNNADVTIFGIHTTVWKDGKQVGEKNGGHEEMLLANHSDVEKQFDFLSENGMWNYAYDKLYRRSIIVDNKVTANSFYDRVCEDTVFLLDLFPYIERLCVVEGCYYNYYIRNTQSVVAKFIPERYEKYYGRFLKTKALMDTFEGSDKNSNYLYDLYCTIIIWAYEFMFHADCDYSLIERYRYMKKLFSIRKESKEFCGKAASYIQQQSIYTDASGTTQKVLINILKNRYFLAWAYHVLALARRKKNA
jgi:glycosyltransferase involved in cell wall biosynthesis